MSLLRSIDAIVTDPVWPGASADLVGRDDPHGLFAGMWDALQCGPTRAAIHLGCNTDPRFLAPVPLPFFRTVTLEIIKKSYWGRLLHSGDMGYLFGDPPAARPGHAVIPGLCVSTDARGRITEHPCERKLDHVAWLVEKWTEPDDLVCDPFTGSGTTAVACHLLGRRFVGIEIVDHFAATAISRVIDEMAKPRLEFDPVEVEEVALV